MTDERKAEIITQLTEKGKEILGVVGEDLPKGGYVTLSLWEDTIMVTMRSEWDGKHTQAERTVLDYHGALK